MAGDERQWIRHPWHAIYWGLVGALTLFIASAYFGTWAGDWELFGADGWQFFLGILVALVVGHAAAVGVLALYRDEPSDPDARRRGMCTGLLERLAFGALVALPLPGAGAVTGIVLWISANTAVNWGPRVRDNGKDVRIHAVSALLASLVGLTLAVAGGLIVQASFAPN